MFLSLIGVVITKENHKGDGESRVTLVPLRATNSWGSNGGEIALPGGEISMRQRNMPQLPMRSLMILTKNLVGTNGVGIGTPLDYPTVPENHGKQEHVLVHFQSAGMERWEQPNASILIHNLGFRGTSECANKQLC